MTRFIPWMALAGCYAPWGTTTSSTVAGTIPTSTTDRAPSATDPACITTREEALRTQPPHALSVGLQVVQCGNFDGVVPLTYPTDIQVYNSETNAPFDASMVAFGPGPAAEVPAYTVMVMDHSDAAHRAGTLTDMYASANLVLEHLLQQGQDDVTHHVAFYELGAPSRSGFPAPFQADRDAVLTQLDLLEKHAENLGASDLYGAHAEALDLALDMATSHPLARRQVVLFTTGTHEAGDTDRLHDSAMRRRSDAFDEVEVYAVTFPQPGTDAARACALATSDHHCIEAGALATLDTTFAELDERLGFLRNSTYGFGICTPVALGEPTLTVEVTVGEARSVARMSYDASLLDGSIQDCDPALWLPANLPSWPE